MRILLAGATGVIGRQVVPVLAAAGHEVTGLARTPARLPDAEVLAGAANAHARHLLDWKPTYTSWRAGLATDLAVRAPL
jgi:uncharacterized protein YbjT (DUF2867 family)